jgi:catechol 2,3-dioxygenase-like lactoylglutathione lyase family enzyme
MSTRPARRFLHVCYCCADTAPVTQFFVDGLQLRLTMSTPRERSDGALLGMDGEIEASAAFVYDARGPRTSPAIEVQDWYDPPLTGVPYDDPTAVGIQPLGFGVPDLASTIERLTALGCSVVGEKHGWATLRDPTGVTLDIVADDAIPADETRMRHLRITCTDVERSLPWYEALGFEAIATDDVKDAAFLGIDRPVDATVARLRLPDEPFEALLVQWHDPASHGRHYAEPNHAGIYRTAVGVDDTRAAFDALSADGVTFDRPPLSVELKGTPVPDMWICFLSDPDGVPFEFVQRPRSAFR